MAKRFASEPLSDDRPSANKMTVTSSPAPSTAGGSNDQKIIDSLFTARQHSEMDRRIMLHFSNTEYKVLDKALRSAFLLQYIIKLCIDVHPEYQPCETFSDAVALIDSFKSREWLVDLLERCTMQGEFYHVRSLRILWQGLPLPDTLSHEKNISNGMPAILGAWRSPYKGDTAQFFYTLLAQYMRVRNHYSRYVIQLQSSGMGKSRVIDELAKTVVCIPICLGGKSFRGYPPRDTEVYTYLIEETPPLSQTQCNERFQMFLYALFKITEKELRSIEIDPALTDKEVRLKALASMFRSKMAEGVTYHAHGPYRADFYRRVVEEAKNLLNTTSFKPADQFPSPEQHEQISVFDAAKNLLITISGTNMPSAAPLVIISFDEAHGLTQMHTSGASEFTEHSIDHRSWSLFSELRRALRLIRDLSIFSVFSSTAGNFIGFSPPIDLDPSARLRSHSLFPFRPIVEAGFDEFAPHVRSDGGSTLEQVASTYNVSHFGRALFATAYDAGIEDVVDFAKSKLLAGENLRKLNLDQQLACIAVRLAVEFRSVSWDQTYVERRQVERHMRIIMGATAGFDTLTTSGSSEPVLAEGAFKAMQNISWDVPRALLDHIDQSYLSAGLRGELVAALILLLSRDQATLSSPADASNYNQDPKADGFFMSRIVGVIDFLSGLLPQNTIKSVLAHHHPSVFNSKTKLQTLEEAFKDAYIWFNHFVKVEDYKMILQENLWSLIARGAAVICRDNHRGVDLVIPVQIGKVLKEAKTTAILIQVKNDASFGTIPRDALFDCMDPFTVGLFDADSLSCDLPVIRLVFALASTKSAVKTVTPPPRISPRSIRAETGPTIYDVWCAGVTPETFNVVEEHQVATYRSLLDRSRDLPTAYDPKDPNVQSPEVVARRRAFRRGLNPTSQALPHIRDKWAPRVDERKMILDDV